MEKTALALDHRRRPLQPAPRARLANHHETGAVEDGEGTHPHRGSAEAIMFCLQDNSAQHADAGRLGQHVGLQISKGRLSVFWADGRKCWSSGPSTPEKRVGRA